MKRNLGRKCRRRGRADGAQRMSALRILKVLELGAGGPRLGRHASEFTRRVGASSKLRRVLLKYANRRPLRRGGTLFRAVAPMASDREQNPENDFRLDAHATGLRRATVHMIVAIGPKGYGFRTPSAARLLLREASRILLSCGEFLVVGRFMNPWFNPQRGSRAGRGYLRATAEDVGLRVVDFLRPLGQHHLASIFRIPGHRFVQRSSDGRKIGMPCYFHRFVRQASA